MKSTGANVAFGVVLTLSVIGGAVFLDRSRAAEEEAVQTRFESDSQVRFGRLLQRIAQKRQLLTSVSAFIEASPTVDVAEFERFVGEHTSALTGTRVCWTSSEGEALMAAPSEGPSCDAFDMLEPSRVVGAPPRIVLSSFAAGENQRGFVSVVFGTNDLVLSDASDSFAEYLVVSDAASNLTHAYRIREERIEATDVARNAVDDRYFELMRYGEVGFFYLTQRTDRVGFADGYPFVLFCMALLVGLAAATYLRLLLLQKARISEEVQKRTEELSQFAYRTSHDLRAPLVTVGGLCQVIQEDFDEMSEEELRESISHVARSVARLDRLVADILDVSRADVADVPRETFDLRDIFEDVRAHLNETFEDHGVELRLKSDGPLRVALPKVRVRQILENLVSNGIKYAARSDDGAFVEGGGTLSPRRVELAIRDNGLGIPKRYQDRVFTMFERFHPQSTYGGSGLGLSIVKKHVDRMNGEIQFQSTEGKGTRFVIHLPLDGSAVSESRASH